MALPSVKELPDRWLDRELAARGWSREEVMADRYKSGRVLAEWHWHCRQMSTHTDPAKLGGPLLDYFQVEELSDLLKEGGQQ